MTTKAKRKGYRTVACGKKIFIENGYICANLEKSGKFIIEKDLFGLWDCLFLRGKKHVFVQFKTNKSFGKKKLTKWTLPYIEFGKEHGSDFVEYEIWNKWDRKGFEVLECNKKRNGIENNASNEENETE